MSVISRTLGVKAGPVYSGIKKARQFRAALRDARRRRQRPRSWRGVGAGMEIASRPVGRPLSRVLSWPGCFPLTRRAVDLRGQSASGETAFRRIWTAVVEEPDGGRWSDFAVGSRGEATLRRLYGRLPAAELYRSDGYRVYHRRPADRQVVGKGGAVNRNEGLRSRLRGKLS